MSNLTVQFWGTRGSIPTPGPSTTKYGGNTTCMEIRHEDTRIVIDAGSGIRQLGQTLTQMPPQTIHLFLTHTHWDHIQGLPFFAPVYSSANQVKLWSEKEPDCVMDVLRDQMRTPYFPVPFDVVSKNLAYQHASSEFGVGSISVRTQRLPHPGGSLGYRLEAEGKTIVVATDCELESRTLSEDSCSPWYRNRNMLDFFEDADLVVIDCQYTDEEYEEKVGWGHNSISAIVDLCRRTSPAELALFHHDPASDDNKIDAMVRQANRQLAESGHCGTKITAAQELTTLSVRKAQRNMAAAHGFRVHTQPHVALTN